MTARSAVEPRPVTQAVSVEPTWFGPADRPLAGLLHRPAGPVRGGVLLCPPLGYEQVVSHRSFRHLAQALAAQGLAVLRFDYDGTGDSAGSAEDPGRVDAWRESIRVAAGYLEPAGPLAVVGMRFAALLAAEAAVDLDADALVLWDPVPSGTAYVRTLRAAHLLADLGPSTDGYHVHGAHHTAETVAAMRTVTLPALPPSLPTLALVRPEVTAPPGAAQHVIPDQTDFLEADTAAAIVPTAEVELLTDWVTVRLAGPPRQFAPARTATAHWDGITETATTVAGCFAVETAPTAVRGPAVLLLNVSVDHHVGPSRAWVEVARRLAADGMRTLRVDLPGIGETPAPPEVPEQRPYGPTAVAAARAIAEATDTGSGVALVGLCSGGRHALDAVSAGPLDARISTVVTVNPGLFDRSVLEAITVEDPLPEALVRVNAYHRFRHHTIIRMPRFVLRALDLLGLLPARAQVLADALGRGAHVHALYGELDWGLFKLRETSGWTLDDLGRRPDCDVVVIPGLDHSAMNPDGRRRLLDEVVARLRATRG